MVTIISLVHILIAVVLVLLVLVQDSKGAMGGMLGGGGGGGSNSLFGATGAASFIVKVTRYVAVLFAATCIALTIMSTQSTSVVDDYLPAAAPIEKNVEETATTPQKAEAPTKKETEKK